jgi:hypothetical protein
MTAPFSDTALQYRMSSCRTALIPILFTNPVYLDRKVTCRSGHARGSNKCHRSFGGDRARKPAGGDAEAGACAIRTAGSRNLRSVLGSKNERHSPKARLHGSEHITLTRNRREQFARVSLLWISKYIRSRTGFNDLATMHHSNSIADVGCYTQIMRDEHHCKA